MLVFAPVAIDQLAESEADIPLAALFAAAGLCGWLWLTERDTASLVLAAILGGGVAATKLEGVAFAGGLFLTLTVLGALRSRRDALPPRAGRGRLRPRRPCPGDCGCARTRSRTRPRSGASPTSATSPRTSAACRGRSGDSAGRALDPRRRLLLVPLAAVAVVLAARRGRKSEAAYVAAVVVLGLAGLALAFATSDFELAAALDHSGRRVGSGLVLFAAALTPFLLADRRDAPGDDDYPLAP